MALQTYSRNILITNEAYLKPCNISVLIRPSETFQMPSKSCYRSTNKEHPLNTCKSWHLQS